MKELIVKTIVSKWRTALERTNFSTMRCSLARGLELIGDWWTPLIVRDLALEVNRFDDLVDDLGISRNVLTRRLKALVERGVIEKVCYNKLPPRYEYKLTAAGEDLVPVFLALTAWGDKWARPKEGSPIVFVHDVCGATIEPMVACPHCRAAIKTGEVTALPGPGGAAKRGTKVIAQRLRARAMERRKVT